MLKFYLFRLGKKSIKQLALYTSCSIKLVVLFFYGLFGHPQAAAQTSGLYSCLPNLSCGGTQDYSNYGLNSNGNAATIEYDNFVSGFHATMARTADGVYAWGDHMRNDGTPLLTPALVNSTNYPGLSGTILKFGVGSYQQAVVLTTNGLFTWGYAGLVINTDIKSGDSFQKINGSQIGSADVNTALPAGVSPEQVKMMFVSANLLSITTCDGRVFILSSKKAAVVGNGLSTFTTTNPMNKWYQVMKSAGVPLTGIVAARGNGGGAMMALDQDSKVWAWGDATFLGNATTHAIVTYATEMTLPAYTGSGHIKMIGMTAKETGNSQYENSYYILYSDGTLYSLGNNAYRQLGDFSNTTRTTWVQPSLSVNGSSISNIKWISPNEHDVFPAINVILTDGTLLNWGLDSYFMLGRNNNTLNGVNPGTPPSAAGDKFLAIETGGHTTLGIRQCNNNFGYVGHRINGSMGNGSAENVMEHNFSYATFPLKICGSNPDIELTASDACQSNTFTVTASPDGGTFTVLSGNSVYNSGSNSFTRTAPGAIEIRYNAPAGCDILTKNITIPECSAPAIALVKTGVLSGDGNTITYTFTVKNTGNVTLNPVTVTDAKLSPSNVTLLATTLAPGEETTGTATYTVTPGEKTTGLVQNTATATGTPPTGSPVTDVSGTDFTNNTPTVVPVPGADLAVVKAVNNLTPMVGSQVTFTITASNNGPSNATGVVVNDPLPAGYTLVSATPSTGTWSAPNWTIGNLANGANATLTVVATVNATGNYTNVGTINGNEEDYNLTNNTSSAIVNPNDCINGTNLITNGIFPTSGGNTNTLSGWTVGGTYGGVWGSGRGRINLSSRGLEFRRDASTITTLEQNLSGVSGGTVLNINDIQWTKTFVNNNTSVFVLDISYGGVVYATVNSTFGNTPSIVAVNGASVNINSLPTVTGNPSRNNPIYSDFANLAITLPNSVSADGDLKFEFIASSDGTEVRDISMKSVSILGCPGADLSVTKTANNPTPQIGQNVTFTITASNAGPSAATGVVVNDQIPAGYTLVSATPSTGTWTAPNWTIGNLANGANATLTVVATVNATGPYANTATIIGTEPDPNPGNNTDTETPVPTAAPAPRIALIKTGILSTDGNTITYSFTVTNTGNVPLTNVTVNDPKLTPSSVTLLQTSLAVGQSTTGTGTYTVTTSDRNTGSVTNTATATGNPPTGSPVTDISGSTQTNDTPTVVPVTSNPSIALLKTGVLSANGNTVTYSFTVKNTGNVTLNPVTVTDAKLTPSNVTLLATTLAPGAETTGTATYTVTAAEKTAGQVQNTATATGTPPTGNPVTDVSGTDFTNNTPTVVPVPGADLELTKVVSDEYPSVGGQVTFTVTAKNNGPSNATGVVVTDALPSGYVLLNATPSTGVWSAPNWSIGNLANGASASMTIVATVAGTGNHENVASVTGNQPDPTPGNNTDSATTYPGSGSDLEVTKTPNNFTPNVGDQITFTITAKNNGPRTATGVNVTDALPSGYTFVSATPSQGVWSSPVWSVGTLANGASASMTVVATVGSKGVYRNTAIIDGIEPDPNPLNDTASVVPSPGSITDLEVIKTVNNAMPNIGEQVTFTIQAKNNGPRNATGVLVNDVLPSGYTYVSHTTSIGTWSAPNWSVGNLANGANATLTIVATVNGTGTYANKATIEGEQPDDKPENNEDTAVTSPGSGTDLAIEKTVDIANPSVGQSVTFTITAKNNGPRNATGVVVTDQIPSGFVVINATPSVGTWSAPNWTIGNLSNGASATLTVVATVNASGNYTNVASIDGNEPDPDPSNNEDEATTPTPENVADLQVTKVADNMTPAIGSQVTFTITAKNNGPKNATGVVVQDMIPAGYVVMSATPSVGNWSAPNWSIGNLANGASQTLTIVAVVNATGSYANTATITGNQVDPDPNNNTSTVTPTPPANTPGIALVKTGVLSTDGNTITYSFTVTNTGNVPLTNVAVNDPKLTPTSVTLLATTLAVGASTTGTGTYTVTAGDRTAGSVTNTATATGNPPTGAPVTDVSGTTQTNDTPTVVPIGCVPDLNPAITVLPNNGISGQRDMVVLLDIKEILGCATTAGQEVRVSVAKVSDFSFNWAPYATATAIPVANVTGLENSRWTFSETTTAWVWVYNAGVINANEISNIGFMGIWNAGASSGKLNFTVTIRNGSGGETNTLNNVDYETVTYDVAP